jgi:hypothetical protein
MGTMRGCGRPCASAAPANASDATASASLIATAPRRRRRNDLVEDLVLPDHAELEARALLDRLEALFQVTNLGVECVVARLQLRVLVLLRREAAVELPDPQPAALADPERVLERDVQRGEDEGMGFHCRGLKKRTTRDTKGTKARKTLDEV